MEIPQRVWQRFLELLRKVNDRAAKDLLNYVETHPDWNTEAGLRKTVDVAFALATEYGEMSASIACEMYDALAEASGVSLPPAVPAETAEYGEVAKAVRGTAKTGNPEIVSESVSRLVKRSGVDTTMQNAIRDGAEWAWIPSGDTCAFCITLSSRGWQKASKKAMKGGHAEHVHANCDCTYAVRFDSRTNVAGYDPDAYLALYEHAAGRTPEEKINSMRRAFYAENADEINAQKRSAYARRRERENSAAEEANV